MLRDRGGSERGSVAITVALSLTLLLAFAALVVDVGLNWAARTSAQTAADSAALAGASTLLLDGPGAAFDTVETFLSNNQVTLPAAAGWADDGVVSNGEVVCWTMPDDPPDPPPGPGLNCPDGSNALQVITPPINVQYAFAPILGRASNSIKATAAAGAGPAAPNNCVLCLLEPSAERALEVVGTGEVNVDGGGIVVNSDDPLLPGAIAKGVRFLGERPGILVAYPDWQVIDPASSPSISASAETSSRRSVSCAATTCRSGRREPARWRARCAMSARSARSSGRRSRCRAVRARP